MCLTERTPFFNTRERITGARRALGREACLVRHSIAPPAPYPGSIPASGARREGTREGRWTLLDYVDIVVHIQHQDERNFYALDRLWRDCPTVPVDLDSPEDTAGEPTE